MSTKSGALVWDLPVRVLHWSAAGLFAVAFGIATLGDDEGAIFPVHALVGVVLMAVVAARVIWAVVGSRTARLSSFDLNPPALLEYLRASVRSTAPPVRKVHNPATSWYAAAALAALLGLGITGYLLGRGNEGVEELHEFFAYAMLAFAGVHVAGVLAHTVRTREPIVVRMVTGRAAGASRWQIPASRRPLGVVFALLAIAWAATVWSAYDPARRTLGLGFGAPLVIGEVAGQHEHGSGTEREDQARKE